MRFIPEVLDLMKEYRLRAKRNHRGMMILIKNFKRF
jgi:hypothetical protein